MLDDDVKWFISTCHPCQTCQTHHLHLPPTVPTFPHLFHKSISTRCSCQPSTSFAISFRPAVPFILARVAPLRKENKKTLGDLYSRISFANGVEWLRLLLIMDLRLWLQLVTCLRNMAFITSRSPYKSQANGIVERKHFDICESPMKTCNNKHSKRVTIWHPCHLGQLNYCRG